MPNFPEIVKNPLSEAIRTELLHQNTQLLAGIQRYQTHPFQRPESVAKTIWQNGTTRLLDFAPDMDNPAATVLFIPSLINRYYILDLMQGHSFTAFLSEHNIRPLVVDWQNPGQHEQTFNSEDYILKRLQPALGSLQTNAPIVVAGYCMGGLLALALAQLAPHKLAGLALLACPWDFHSPDFARAELEESHIRKLEEMLAHHPTLPGEVLQTLFYTTNPWVFTRKFIRFSQMEPHSDDAKRFVSVEGWVNDAVPMAAPLARECLIDWTQHNAPARGNWQIDGQIIKPEAIDIPSFVSCPERDKVVPPLCAGALATRLPHSTHHKPDSGHIGMVAGPRGATQLWHPFLAWIHAQIRPQ